MFSIVAGAFMGIELNGPLAYDWTGFVGAAEDSTFVHKNCFNTYGEPVGLQLSPSTRISMTEAYSWGGRAQMTLTDFTLPDDNNIPSSCASSGTLSTDSYYYDLADCGVSTITERLTICAAICTHVDNCVATELVSPGDGTWTRCQLHETEGFEEGTLLTGVCQEFPFQSPSGCSVRSDFSFIATICPTSPIDETIYTDRSMLKTNFVQQYNPNFYRMGNYLKIEYPDMASDYMTGAADDTDGVWSFCYFIRDHAAAALIAYFYPQNDTLTETAAALFLIAQCTFLLVTAFVFYVLIRVIKSKFHTAGVLASAMPATMMKGVIGTAMDSVA